MKASFFFSFLVGLIAIVAKADTAPVREIQVIVDKGTYTPSRIDIAPGQAVRLKVLRKEYTPCTKDIVFPSLGISRELPVGKEVVIDVPAQAAGEVPFRCGMNMVKGSLVVQP